MVTRHLTLVMLAAALAWPVAAQQVVYPAKGQKPEQQKTDEAACQTWAVQQSGFDPAKPPPPPAAPPPTTATGADRGSGARGAARGAVVGEVIADDASTGAAVGAAAARGQSRRENNSRPRPRNSSSRPPPARGRRNFAKARAACLEGKGYTVK